MAETRGIFEPYVPLLVRRHFLHGGLPAAPAAQTLAACLMVADASGFTPLVEELSREEERGAEAVQVLLNRCFGPLVERIDAWGGDLLCFPGDAALALWTAPGPDALDTAVRRATQCALEVQAALDRPVPPEERRLRFRIALGAGLVWAASVGGEGGRWHLFVGGEPLAQLGVAIAEAQAGEVVLSADAARLVAKAVEGAPAGSGLRVSGAAPAPDPPGRQTPSVIGADALRAYVPRTVRARIDAGQREWLGEFRRVSVAFVGIGGFVPGGPESLDRLQRAVSAIQAAVYRLGGSVNQLVTDEKGTALVLAWGLALHTHEDDAERAVRAALEIERRLAELAIECRIGVATDRVFTGRRGGPDRMEFGLIGSGVNRAARLMAAAQPILCDASTHAAARRRILFASLPPMPLKGIAEPVRVYRPHALRQTTAFIGRESERRILEQRVQELEVSARGGAIFVEGEPGIGKTRLISHLLERVRTTGVRALLGGADAIEQRSPYHAWKPVLGALLGLGATRSAEDSIERLAQLLQPDEIPRAPLLNPMLPAPLPETQLTRQMAAPGRAEGARELLVRILRRASERAPILLVLDDAQWMDSASWELANAARRELAPLLLVVSTRPLGDALDPTGLSIRNDESTVLLELDVLAPDEALALICRRLDVDSVPGEVAQLVQARAEGHPFFTEELIHALRDKGLLEMDDGECRLAGDSSGLARLELPHTVQGVVTTRIDHLSPRQQLTLKVASVLGRRFAIEELREVHPIADDRAAIGSQLASMVQVGLLRRDGAAHCRFKHAIVQEAAYQLLSIEQRRELHRRVAEHVEDRLGSSLPSLQPILAHHWRHAGCPERAAEHLARAGEQALLRDHANREAAHFFEELLALDDARVDDAADRAVVLPGRRRIARRVAARARVERQLGEALLNLGRHDEGVPHVERSLELLGERLRPRALTARLALGLAARLLAGPPRVPAQREAHLGEDARGLLADAIRAYERLGMSAYSRGTSVSAAIHALLRGLALSRGMGPSPELAQMYADFANVAELFGRRRLAGDYASVALETAREADDPAARAFVLSRTSLPRLVRGDWDTGKAFDEAMSISDGLGDHYQWGESAAARAYLEFLRGDASAASARFGLVLERARRSGALMHQIWALSGGADALLRLGHLDDAIELAQQALALRRESTSAFQIHGILASAWLRKRGPEGSEPWAGRAEAAMTPMSCLGFGSLSGFVGIAEHHLSAWRAGEPGRTSHARALRRVCRALRFTAWFRPILGPAALRFEGLRQWRLGRPQRARRASQRSLALAERLGMPYDAACARLELGLHLPATDPQRRGQVERAAATFARLGAAWDLERATQAAAS